MDITAPIPVPSKSELRKFAFIMAGMVSLFFGVLVPWLWGLGFIVWPWPVCAVFALWGTVWPKGLQPVHWVWMRFGMLIGWVNSRIILGIVFYLIITPAGLVMRWLGNDPMHRELERDQLSYRKSSIVAPAKHFERPY